MRLLRSRPIGTELADKFLKKLVRTGCGLGEGVGGDLGEMTK